jgi:short-subunit dehydrogenase
MSGAFAGKSYWLVGASQGLGAEIARQLHQARAHLILSARNKDKLDELSSELQGSAAVPVDVSDEGSVKKAVQQIGAIDGVIYCVGQYEPMSTAEWDIPKSLQIIDANFLGAVRVLGSVVPEMLDRGTGHVVVVGSLAGFHGLPGAIGYSASKGAVMQLSENIFMDTRGTNVKVQQINPGYIQTRLAEKNDFRMPSIMSPQAAAARVVRAMEGSRFRTVFPRPFAWLFTIGRLLPARLFRAIFV